MSGGTDNVWFYDMEADGLSLDDKRTELLPPEKQGPVPAEALTEEEELARNNLPDILARWGALEAEAERPAHRAKLHGAAGGYSGHGHMGPVAQPLQGSGAMRRSIINTRKRSSPSCARLRPRSPKGWIGWRGCWDEHGRPFHWQEAFWFQEGPGLSENGNSKPARIKISELLGT